MTVYHVVTAIRIVLLMKWGNILILVKSAYDMSAEAALVWPRRIIETPRVISDTNGYCSLDSFLYIIICSLVPEVDNKATMRLSGVTRRCWHRKWLFAVVVIAFVVLAQVFPVLRRPLGHIVELWTSDKRLATQVSDSLFTPVVIHQSQQRRRERTVYAVSPPFPVHRAPPGEHVSQLRRGERKRPLEGSRPTLANMRPTDR